MEVKCENWIYLNRVNDTGCNYWYIAIPKYSDVSESAKRNACRANIRTIVGQETMFFATHHTFTGDLAELGMSGVVCPSSTEYGIYGVSETYAVSCLFSSSHGNITDGVASWHDSGI